MVVTKRKMATNAKYDATHMMSYTVKYRKDIYEKVEQAVIESGMNRNSWTVKAIKEKLGRDGFLPDESLQNDGEL